IGELFEAAKADWRKVEPAIFGTLLEQALNPAERRKLGAHYTPRAYVERLVTATVLEPLKADWASVQAAAEEKRGKGDTEGAAALIQNFHAKLCGIRILDPACGTGNFLYVALELLKQLEGEVLEALASLAGDQETLHWLQGQTIDPHQFLGMEVNPRAAAIAELVLWIGYLQWHFRTRGGMPPEPILRDFKTIEVRDAVLAWDAKELARDDKGKPIARRDAEGNQVEAYRYTNPKRPEWPEADFIVGNPPFIGGKDIRGRLGEGYVKALWAAHPHMNESADFVMYWWDRAAGLLTRKSTRLKRFGLVTTNSLSQVFQRRVMEKYLKAKAPVSLLMAIADHPWSKATRDASAVRIAMTVAQAGTDDGRLFEVTKEEDLDTDAPNVELRETRGRINSDLSVGADVTALPALQANAFISSRGVVLHGASFIVTPSEADHLGLGKRPGLENHIRHYRNGRDLMGTPRAVMALDLFGLEADDLRKRFPEVYQYILENIKPDRDHNPRSYRREKWWLFGENVPDFRKALEGLPRYIATVETAKHRVFQFLDASILPDNMLVCMALDDALFLGVLSSRFHVVWALGAGGTLEDRPRYTKSHCFDPFPVPDPPEALKSQIRESAEELDALRKRVQAEHLILGLTGEYRREGPSLRAEGEAIQRHAAAPELLRSEASRNDAALTLTQIYNVLEKLRAGEPLRAEDEAIKTKGLVLILRELHDKIDALVAQAYGWPNDLSDDEILARLVALNAGRAAEEKRGLIRWLRPDYQRARAGVVAEPAQAAPEEQLEAELVIEAGKVQKPAFPAADVERMAAVYAALAGARAPLDARAIASTFRQGARVEPAIARILAAWARVGQFHTSDGKSFSLRRGA
ncbi:MAG: class I SAM-dependent DNA methyltransferase, partial [Beijerinckiaceae bacterium]|nr:class I SAM-dependent DNA methyltransferase [Beijerinckiaceae bacterium]